MAVCLISSIFPLLKFALLFGRHGSCSHGVTLPVRKEKDHAEKIPPSIGLSKDIIGRVLALGFGAEHQRISKADLLDLRWRDAVEGNMIDSVCRLDEFSNPHGVTLSLAA